jgi:hypothetical protein
MVRGDEWISTVYLPGDIRVLDVRSREADTEFGNWRLSTRPERAQRVMVTGAA